VSRTSPATTATRSPARDDTAVAVRQALAAGSRHIAARRAIDRTLTELGVGYADRRTTR
jgi:hypothetical protein